MTSVWALAALWLGLAVIAGLFSMWLRVSTALCEIVVGTLAQLILTAVIGAAVLGTDEGWVKFLAGIGPGLLLVTLFGIYAVFRFRKEYAAAHALYAATGTDAATPAIVLFLCSPFGCSAACVW